MIRNLWWLTIAAALTALAGAAWAEEPSKDAAKAAPPCCSETGCCPYISGLKACSQGAAKGCCADQAAGASCCAKGCCANCGKESPAAKDGACCPCCGKDCSCCTKAAAGCCGGKDVACAKGCACCCAKTAAACCCGKATATRTGQKKQVVVYVVTVPGMPGPLPVPAVGVPPAGPLGPITVLETPDGMRHLCAGAPAPVYACPPPAPVAPERLPPPAPIVSDPGTYPVPGHLTGSASVPPPPPPLPAPPALTPYGVAAAPEVICRCRLETATEDGETHLKVWSGPSTCVTCDRLDLKVAGFSGFKVAVADKQVRLHTPSADAKADRIAVSAQEDQLILEGHVRLQYRLSEAEHADVSASRVVVYLADGRVEIQPTRPEPRATQAPTPPALDPVVFSFFTGLSR